MGKKIDYHSAYGNSVYISKYESLPINKKLQNLYLKINGTGLADINIYLTDEANKLYYDAGVHHYFSSIKKSHYIKLHTSGQTEKIKLVIESKSEIDIEDIKVNQIVPIDFNILRFVLVCGLLITIIIFKKYKIFSLNFDEFKYKFFLVFLLFVIFIGIYIFINFSSRGNINTMELDITQHHQYQLLARTLAKGNVVLGLKVSDKLLQLDNPYDQAYRDSLLTMNKDYYLDYAFYNGKYYSYFGIVPCLLLHLPYYLLTGNDLNNSITLTLGCFLYVFAAFYLVYQLFKKYFPKVSFKVYLLCAFLLSFCSGISYVIRIGYFYGLPIVMGAAFAMLGIGMWLRSLKESKINKKYLFFGSLLMALVAGCRPQIVLSSFLIIPIFWKQIKNKEIFKIKNLICICLPYLLVAAGLMYYNFVRFGSVLDFGANYNLTSNDMTQRGFVFDRIFLGLFSFLFEVPHINSVFPFINIYEITSNYHGITIYEHMAGGFITLNILILVNFFIFKLKKDFKDKKLFYLCLCMVLFALIIVISDTQMAGILPRYICDFGFLITLSTIIIIMTIFQKYSKYEKMLFKVFSILVILSIFYNFLIYFTDITVSEIYDGIVYYFYYLFMFWL